MHVGELIERLTDEAAAEELLVAAADLPFLSALRTRAEAAGMSAGAYLSEAVGQFCAEASGEDWTSLIGALNAAADPGLEFLKRAVGRVTA